jgi:SAM-dependent methyltransferase
VVSLVARYFFSQGISRRSIRNFHPGLFDLAADLNHAEWGYYVRDHIRGKDVLDLGCGHTLYGIGFLIYGARSYLGIDPKLEIDAPKLRRRDRFCTVIAQSPWTLRRVQAAVPCIRYAPWRISELPADDRFDVIFMHNVTEHLLAIDEVFSEVRARLRPGGKIIYRHHNYASWNGHHQRPRTTAQIDPADPAQAAYLDWAHLDFDSARYALVARRLNRIRLHELRGLTEKFFKIEKWEDLPSRPEQGAERLSNEILVRHPNYTREELLTQAVMCVAQVPSA